VLGRAFQVQKIGSTNGTHVELDVRHLPAGVYLLHVGAGGQQVTRRVVVGR